MDRTPPVHHDYSRLMWQLEKPPQQLLKALNLLLGWNEPALTHGLVTTQAARHALDSVSFSPKQTLDRKIRNECSCSQLSSEFN